MEWLRKTMVFRIWSVSVQYGAVRPISTPLAGHCASYQYELAPDCSTCELTERCWTHSMWILYSKLLDANFHRDFQQIACAFEHVRSRERSTCLLGIEWNGAAGRVSRRVQLDESSDTQVQRLHGGYTECITSFAQLYQN